jgi:integrative and conjugative element protein (TIGR02256 family)
MCVMLNYPIGDSGQVLVLSDEVLEHFARYRQLRFYQSEAGGQLFATFDEGRIHVVEATGPRRTDTRRRTSYVPDRRAEQREIDARHERGLHYVGDWHTHPEDVPTPSGRDADSISESVKKSTHTLNAFVLVIAGRAEAPQGLSVCLYDRSGSGVALTPVEPVPTRTG